jgi:hypothetical protein
MLALAQAHHRGLIGGVYGQMKAADAFDGYDFAVAQELDGLNDWVIMAGG